MLGQGTRPEAVFGYLAAAFAGGVVALDGWHEVDVNTDVRIVSTGRLVPADSAPRGELVLIPPYNTRGVRPIRVQRKARSVIARAS